MKAIWNDTVVAESNDTVIIEGNHYFPMESIKKEYFVDSDLTSVCHWKGTANYFSIEVENQVNKDAAWYYPEVSELAKSIKNRVAFWKGVKVKE